MTGGRRHNQKHHNLLAGVLPKKKKTSPEPSTATGWIKLTTMVFSSDSMFSLHVWAVSALPSTDICGSVGNTPQTASAGPMRCDASHALLAGRPSRTGHVTLVASRRKHNTIESMYRFNLDPFLAVVGIIMPLARWRNHAIVLLLNNRDNSQDSLWNMPIPRKCDPCHYGKSYDLPDHLHLSICRIVSYRLESTSILYYSTIVW